MKESPVIRGGFFEVGIDSKRIVGLDFAKGVKIELSDKGTEFRVLEKLRNNFLLEFLDQIS